MLDSQRIPRTPEFQRIPAHARISAQSSARPNFSAFRRTPEFQRIPAHAGISAHSSARRNFSAFQRIAMHSTNAKPRSHGARIHWDFTQLRCTSRRSGASHRSWYSMEACSGMLLLKPTQQARLSESRCLVIFDYHWQRPYQAIGEPP